MSHEQTPSLQPFCCEGKKIYEDLCARLGCPIFIKAMDIWNERPYVGTGFGNLYGEPTHEALIRSALSIMRSQAPKLANNTSAEQKPPTQGLSPTIPCSNNPES